MTEPRRPRTGEERRPRRAADAGSAPERRRTPTAGPRRTEPARRTEPLRRTEPARRTEASRRTEPARRTEASRRTEPGRPTVTLRRTAAAPARSRRPPARPRRPRRSPRTLRLGDPRRRLSVAFLAVCVLFSLFAGRLVQLQGLDASAYAAEAAAERIRSAELPAARGAILDRNGVELAASVDAYDVIVDQVLLRRSSSTTAAALGLTTLLGLDVATLEERLRGSKRYAYVAQEVTPEQARAVRAADIVGITTEARAKRTYPAGTVAGNVVGFAGRDGEGLLGIEQGFDAALSGTPGRVSSWQAPDGSALPLSTNTEVAPVEGSAVRLTLDRDIQWYAEQALTAKVAEAQAASGSLVVMRPQTGEILALASTPSVDPNALTGTAKEQRGNKAVEETYEPGSVMKVLTAAALVDSGTVTADTPFTVPDSLRRSGETISDHSGHGVLGLTFAGVIAESSNVGTILAAEQMDKQRLRDYFLAFGLGARTDLGLPGETAGSVAPDWSDLTRDTSVFGQGVSASIVQMASVYATIANGGVRVPPRLVDEVIAPDGTPTKRHVGEPRRVVSEETAATVTTLMEGVMGPGGTGQRIEVPGYRLAGKTGTAEKVDPACRCYRGFTASFMGFAPADDPQLVVAVSIQDPQNGRYGGTLAGPVFADVTGFALQRLAVVPSLTEAPRVRLTTD